MLKKTISAISLFSGAGGMDIGFNAAGIETVLANDLDRDACETYRRNHDTPLIEGNILGQLETLKSYTGIDVLYGGPPCQGFSVAGKMNPDDERSKLLLTFFDIVSFLKPRAFVCENVKALAELKRWSGVRENILSKTSIEYNVAPVVLNSSDFGVPQNRERVFWIGIHKCQGNISPSDFSKLVGSFLEKEKQKSESVKAVIQKLGRAGSNTNDQICNAKITFALNPVLRKSPYAGMLFNGAGRPLLSSGYASTLPASMGGNKTPIVDEAEIFENEASFIEQYHAHLINGGKAFKGYAPARLRRLTVDECLKFQTFPDNYHLSGKQSSRFRQIGNAVPCKLAEAVANVTKAILRQENIEDYSNSIFLEECAA